MRKPLSPVSLVCGALSFGLLTVHAMVAANVLPHLGDLMRTDPRLAFLGLLALVLFPGVVVTFLHHVGQGVLDRAEPGASRRVLPKVESWWAGVLAWMVLYGATILARLTFLVIDPPPPEGDAFSIAMQTIETQSHLGTAISLYAILWIAIASAFYELERRTRRA